MNNNATNNNNLTDLLSLTEVCKELSISTATGRNWIKLGKLKPGFSFEGKYAFTRQYIDELKQQLLSSDNSSLKSRRNKSFVSGNSLYSSYVSSSCKNLSVVQKLLSLIENENIELSSSAILIFIADCALKLFASQKNLQLEYNNLLQHFLTQSFSVGDYDVLINDLIYDRAFALDFCNKHPLIFNLEYEYEAREDILGLIYLSCKNLGERKSSGSYYTPTNIVKKLITRLDFSDNSRILDPCCGTGNFILQLPQGISFENVYGNDIDRDSILIARINMALYFNGVSAEMIQNHFTDMDYLIDYDEDDFDFIIGNPPWGYDFSDEEKVVLRQKFSASIGTNIESFDVFIERSFNSLAQDGHMSFILPESILNVKAHQGIREHISQNGSIKFLRFLGDAFDGIQCPCIILHIVATGKPISSVGMIVNDNSREFCINTNREISASNFSFTTSDEEYQLIKKIRNTPGLTSLEGNADFALGIVTGNNKKYIINEPQAGYEMILKGSDIDMYHINQTHNYIKYEPDNFQQKAPEEMYRAKEKLLYRFISNKLVFAYDNQQTLSLNSCNIVIPRIAGLHIKYVMAVLNSSIAQYIYRKEYNSIKVLRSHIENLPIPMADEATQLQIIEMADQIINAKLSSGDELFDNLYRQIDDKICELINITDTEKELMNICLKL